MVPLLHWRTTVDSPLPSQPAPLPERDERARRGDAEAARPSFDRRGSAGRVHVGTRPASRARQTPERALQARQHDPARLDALYTESARLEAVLAQLPDTTVGNVAMLAVSADLQDQVAHIDLALSQPALQESARAALWQQRVDTLRQLTGVEATQRWQVALNDTSADTAIY